MFVPIRDHNPTRTVPGVNYLLILANVLAWVWSTGQPPTFAHDWGIVPARLFASPIAESATLLSSIFLHGSAAHLAFNMWSLYIFGDNIEDALGHARYLGFYIAAGLLAGIAQTLVEPTSMIPIIGASGAIAGIVGGYMVLYPRAPILTFNTLLPLWFLIGIMPVVPAWIIAAEFFIGNLFQGILALRAQPGGGVAFFAHLGGFVAGYLSIRALAKHPPRRHGTWRGWRSARSPRSRSR